MAARTYADVWMIRNGTAIERSIISRNAQDFLKYVGAFIGVMLPVSVVNNLLKYGLGELALRFRTRLSGYLYERYLSGFTYYKMSNLDTRIANPDQLLTQDVEKFCNGLADLYSNLAKPVLDIAIYAVQLSRSIGSQGPLRMLLYLLISGTVLTRLRKPVAAFVVNEQKREGQFRYVNSRLITNAEEVAFYGGQAKEKIVMNDTFAHLVSHLRKAMQFRNAIGVVDTIIAKYWATVVGYLVVSRPFLDLLHPRHLHSSQHEIMEDYYRSGRMLVNMASAIGRLVLAGRDLTRLAGFTARVAELMDVLDDLGNGNYKRTMVTKERQQQQQQQHRGKPGDADEASSSSSATATATSTGGEGEAAPIELNSGRIVERDHVIRFEKVPLVTPNGDVLVRSLTFSVESGTNVLIAGPNGCGKSSLFRILGELWPLFGGVVTKPNKKHLFYVPQRPYMTLGTLRDQIIYPHTVDDMRLAGRTDEDLVALLAQVHLAYVVQRPGGLDAVEDWIDVLSGGEKQRVAMARLFYHRPQFAILDECTSAVSADVESFLYENCRSLNITLFTVSHRKQLWKHHAEVLEFDGRGGYTFKKITPEMLQ
jgi:ATP-binding cassette subfamily D (ALD) protein 3